MATLRSQTREGKMGWLTGCPASACLFSLAPSQTIELLEKRSTFLQKKMDTEVERSKEYLRLQNKKAALQCLKRKKLYEQQSDGLEVQILKLQEQQIMLEGARQTTQVVTSMREAGKQMKAIQKDTNIDDVDKVLDDISDHTDRMKEVQDRLSEPTGALADLDDMELEAELEQLESEELDKQLMEPQMPAPAARQKGAEESVPELPRVPSKAPAARTKAKTQEEEELEALQAEMAM